MKNSFTTYFILLVLGQLVICNFFHLPSYISLSILPVLILCTPTHVKTLNLMIIAFISGLVADALGEGVLGLNVLALVPVAASKRYICKLIFGSELAAQNENISIKKYGLRRIITAIFILHSLYLLIYIWADGGAVRSMDINVLRFAASFAASLIAAIPISAFLLADNSR